MKKILSLILALSCVFMLFSCVNNDPDANEGKTDIQIFADKVAASKPTKISTLTSLSDGVNDNSLSGEFVTTLYGESFKMYYKYDYYPRPDQATDPDEYISTAEGTVYYNDGKYGVVAGVSETPDDVTAWSYQSPDTLALQVKFVLEEANLGSYVLSTDGKSLTTTVTAEQAEQILGIAIDASEAGVLLTVEIDGTNLRKVVVSYASENAENVTVETSYSYNAVTSPFAEEEPTPTE